jgi:stearoyl-CoA desaturase (delta-9 desaturase)
MIDTKRVNPTSSDEHEHEHERITLAGRLGTLAAIIIPLIGLVAAAAFLWGWGFSWIDLGLLLGMYLVTALGITVGFHRLFVHRSFDTYMPIKFILAALGSMTVQGSLFNWVAQHRRHHRYADMEGDPHSPHHYGKGFWARLRGFWHAHIGWAFKPDPADLSHYVKDLQQSPTLRIADAMFPVWIVLGLVIPGVLGGLLSGSWMGVWTGMIWGGLVRIFLVHHITWSVNSVGHMWGTQRYETTDQSRDNFVFGILALGEGWHHTHHTFPTSAKHGLRWWQMDVSYGLIRILRWLGLAWNVKVPTAEAQTQAERRTGESLHA